MIRRNYKLVELKITMCQTAPMSCADGASDSLHLALTLPGPSAGVSGSLDSYCSLKPLCSGMGKWCRLVPRRPYFPHPLALCCHYPVSKCRSASIAVTGTLRVRYYTNLSHKTAHLCNLLISPVLLYRMDAHVYIV